MTDRTAKITFDETGSQPFISISVTTGDGPTITTILDGMSIYTEPDEVLYEYFKGLGYEAEVIYTFGGDPDDEDFGEDLGEPLDWEEKDRDPEEWDGDAWREPD